MSSGVMLAIIARSRSCLYIASSEIVHACNHLVNFLDCSVAAGKAKKEVPSAGARRRMSYEGCSKTFILSGEGAHFPPFGHSCTSRLSCRSASKTCSDNQDSAPSLREVQDTGTAVCESVVCRLKMLALHKDALIMPQKAGTIC